jgi:hypothetical protein
MTKPIKYQLIASANFKKQYQKLLRSNPALDARILKTLRQLETNPKTMLTQSIELLECSSNW